MARFQDCVVLITGGTSGIGLATAIKFASEGARHVVVCGRTLAKWEKAKKGLSRQQLVVIEYRYCDVRLEAEIQELIRGIFEDYGQLDVCFNNAGVQPVAAGDITAMDFESAVTNDGSIIYRLPGPAISSDCLPSQKTPVSSHCESPLATSIFGIFYSLKWELDYIYQYQPINRPVAIVNTASRNGILPDYHRPLYAGAKAFIISMTKTLASQAAQRAIADGRALIRINCVAPGPIDTPLERAIYPGDFNNSASVGVPLGRVGSPSEIATVVLFLADPNMSSYITGTTISADGGYTSSPIF